MTIRMKPLNVAEICPATRALGPGLRSVLWVQGCPIGCKGCIAQDWIPMVPASLWSPSQAADQLLSNPEVEGVTISGGEPMVQAEGLAALIRILRSRKNLHIICFTGFVYEGLILKPLFPGVQNLLDLLDVLIDGPYLEKQNSGDTFAGSRNQRILKLSDRPAPAGNEWTPRKTELHIRNGNILAVGVPPRNLEKDWITRTIDPSFERLKEVE